MDILGNHGNNLNTKEKTFIGKEQVTFLFYALLYIFHAIQLQNTVYLNSKMYSM